MPDAGPDQCFLNFATAAPGPLLSDFEGSTPLTILSLPHPGSWLTDTDGTGTIGLSVVPGGVTGNAARLAGSGHTMWGGDMNAYLMNGFAYPVDASAYQGVRFFLRGLVGNGMVFVKLQNSDSLGMSNCGCDFASTDPTLACYGGYWVGLEATDAWREVRLPWSCFVPSPYGYHARDRIDPSEILNLAIGVQLTAAPASWELWIDDVGFY
jgi:hypothetical protein